MSKIRAAIVSTSCCLAALILPGSLAEMPGADKLKPEEVLEKHLASIGTPEARSAARSRALRADARVVFRIGGTGQFTGSGNVLSDGRMLRIGMNFPSPGYPGEQVAFDGKDVKVGQVRPGERSPLCDLIYSQDYIVREGLLGGTLSTAWPLLELAERRGRLEYRGLKKQGEKQVHEVLYKPKRVGMFQILLYFDAETFRHVGTRYRLTRPALMGRSIGEAAGARDTVHLLVETFDDFKTVDGVTLPHSYKLSYTVEGGNATLSTEWTMTVTQLANNQKVDPKYFTIQ